MKPDSVYKLLIVNLGGMGDMLLSSPAVRAIATHFAHAERTILTSENALSCAEHLRLAPRVVSIPVGKIGGIGAAYATLRRLKNEHFDLLVNMRTLAAPGGAGKMRLLCWYLSARITAGRNTNGWGGFFDIQSPEQLKESTCEMAFDARLTKALGIDDFEATVQVAVSEGSRTRAQQFLLEQGIPPRISLIGIHPGGKQSHQWPLRNYRDVMEKMRAHSRCCFLITAHGQEVSGLYKLREHFGQDCVIVNKRLAFEDLAALIAACRVFISNDTGPMHLAAALSVPLVAIFGPGYLARFDPRCLEPQATVFHRPVNCAPCNRVHCHSKRCFAGIRVNEVAEAALAKIQTSL